MTVSVPMTRVAAATLVLAVLGTSGCSWFHRNSKEYAGDPASRPLEVPPELDMSQNQVTASGNAARQSVVQPNASAGVQGGGFLVAGSRDDAFKKVGDALAAVPGLTIASRAQLLGAFDVNYEGANFLVRVSAAEAGAYVSAVDPRGLPAAGEAPRKLIDKLKTALGSR